MNEQPRSPASSITLVWLALMILLAITVGSSFIDLGPGNVALNVLIAIFKAAFVVAFFMHLRHGLRLVRLLALIGLTTLGILFILSGLDYLTRKTDPAPWQHTVPSLSSDKTVDQSQEPRR